MLRFYHLHQLIWPFYRRLDCHDSLHFELCTAAGCLAFWLLSLLVISNFCQDANEGEFTDIAARDVVLALDKQAGRRGLDDHLLCPKEGVKTWTGHFI